MHRPSPAPSPAPTVDPEPLDPPHAPKFGRPAHWARDLALVGGLTALGLGLVGRLPTDTVWVLSGLAALFGAGLGAAVPRLFHPEVRRVPVVVLLFAGVGLGGSWGGAAGLIAALATDGPWVRATELAATACAVQLGWLWLPTLLGRANGRATWPWVVLACLASPLVGWLAYSHVTW